MINGDFPEASTAHH